MATDTPTTFVPDEAQSENLTFVPDVVPKLAANAINFPRIGVGRQPSPTLGQEILSSIPLYGAPSEFRSGQQAGNEFLGNNLAGDILGVLAGTGKALTTIVNPVGKVLNFTSPLTQSIGSLFAGDTGQAVKDITNQTPVISSIPFLPNARQGQEASVDTGLGTAANTLANLIVNGSNVVRTQPVAAVPAIAGGIGFLRNPSAGVSSLATGIENLANKTVEAAKSPARTLASSGVPIATGIGNIAEKVASRGFISKPIEDVVTKTIGIEPINGGVDTFQAAKTAILQETGKLPTRDTGLANYTIDAANKTQKALLNNTSDILNAADDSGLVVHGTPAVEQARSLIEQRFPLFADNEGAVDSVLSQPEFANISDNISPTDARIMLTELNKKYDTLEHKDTPQGLAYRTVRNYLSDQVDGVIKVQSGQDINPFRDWGHVQDFKDGLQGSIEQAQNIDAGRNLPGSRLPPTGIGSAVKKVAQKVGARALIPRVIETIDSGLRTGFDKIPNRAEPTSLSQDQINSLRSNFEPIPEAATQNVPPPNLDKLIQQRIKNAPVKEKRSGMARLAAIQDLKDQGLIPQDTPLQ